MNAEESMNYCQSSDVKIDRHKLQSHGESKLQLTSSQNEIDLIKDKALRLGSNGANLTDRRDKPNHASILLPTELKRNNDCFDDVITSGIFKLQETRLLVRYFIRTHERGHRFADALFVFIRKNLLWRPYKLPF